MGPGDFNPVHTHLNCHFSSVVFLKVGKKLKEENDSYVGLSRGPGSLNFLYGNQATDCISEAHFFPVEGDFYIFPRNLYHFVQPYKADAERISVSSNFIWK